jgi:hypothetical protein
MRHVRAAATAFAVFVAGCAAASGPDDLPASSDARIETRASSPITYESLVEMIRARQLSTIDAVLAQPELTRSFRRGFTAVFASKSIQHADPLNPRIILYGIDATLILAFTCATGDCGDATSVAGADHLEMIQWRDETKSFELRDIDFHEGQPGPATFSEANPPRCLACHEASDPRPNWEPYNQWPGIYGGDDDGAQPEHATPGESRADLDRFLTTGPQRSRYRQLYDLVGGYQYIYDYGGKHYTDSRTASHHNIDLNEAVYLLNDQRIVDRIRRLPFYGDIKHALVLGLGGGRLSDPLRAIGHDDVAALVDRCATGQHAASRIVQLLHGLGAESLPWFMSLGSSVESELAAPSLTVESKVSGELIAGDADLSLDYAERSRRAAEGWSHLLATLPVSEGLTKCASGRSALHR